MPMRTHCKHYESRTYPSGDSVQKCDLDLAPEAPWRCPENCPAFAPRMVDAGWAWGPLQSPPAPKEPPNLGEGAAALLDEAEDIVNAIAPDVFAEFKRLDEQKSKGWLGRLPTPKRKRKKKRGK
ncbi:MAG TPA: hypothetical protein VI854_02215 [Acidimicrobiia bacterium]|nr:hypothetical protein [Acidimicrobiia bacterium]